MTYFLVLGLVVLAVIGLILLPGYWRRFRRQRLVTMPFPAEYDRVLTRNLPLYRSMPAELRQQLQGHVLVFLNEKRFFGCQGLQMTDEIRVTVAGHACLLLLNRTTDYFPGFTSILVYPDTYVAEEVTYDGAVEVREEVPRAGESWHRGPVILSWQDILHGLSAGGGGMNVILHEFAHKLDEQDGETEGLPVLADDAHYEEWARVLTLEYARLEEAVDAGNEALLDDYALHSPAEFFAVATEVFFERPSLMRQELPELYRQLERYYRVDPAAWTGRNHVFTPA